MANCPDIDLNEYSRAILDNLNESGIPTRGKKKDLSQLDRIEAMLTELTKEQENSGYYHCDVCNELMAEGKNYCSCVRGMVIGENGDVIPQKA